jgi:PASTA domain
VTKRSAEIGAVGGLGRLVEIAGEPGRGLVLFAAAARMFGVRRARALLAVVSAVVVVAAGEGVNLAVASSPSVPVPHLVGMSVARGYALLRREGLKVTIPRGFEVDSLAAGDGEILSSVPGTGRRVRGGSTVSLKIGCRPCAWGSPAVPSHIPAYRVPNFVGGPVSAVLRWITPKTLYLTEHFGPIYAGAAAQLAGNYHLARQHPAPGATLRLGIGHRTGPNSGGFLPTPLTVWLERNR